MSSSRRVVAPVPAIMLPTPAAAAAMGVSVDSFARHIAPDIRCVRRGALRLYPVVELERWAAENAEALFDTSSTTAGPR